MKKLMTKSLLNWRGTLAVIGIDWGDSGKGRLVDDLAQHADIVARFAGGSNTGHTVKNQYGQFALHIIPCGIFNPKATCLIGRNVAVDAQSLIYEMTKLDDAKISYDNLVIDEQASLTMPWHKMRDGLRERTRNKKIGTTLMGVGPTYADRVERAGILVKDLAFVGFKQKLEKEIAFQNKYYKLNLDASQIFEKYTKITEKIKKFIGKTTPLLKDAHQKGKTILFEGAQGYFLDIDAGTYPYVTSSNPGIVGIWRCFDLHPSYLSEIIGITKAYMTRVGEGPMPTAIVGKEAKIIVDQGKEFGTTTGRPRTPGWLDLVLVKEASQVNALTGLAITKLDVLSQLKKIKLCIGYKNNGRNVGYISHDSDYLSKVKPVYQQIEGWQKDISAVRSFEDLPKMAQKFIKIIEDFVNVPVKFISVGAKRGQVIYV